MSTNDTSSPAYGITLSDLSTPVGQRSAGIQELAQLYFSGAIPIEDMRNFLQSNATISSTNSALRAATLGSANSANGIVLPNPTRPYRADVPFRFSFSNYGGIKSPSNFSIKNGANFIVLPVPPAGVKVVDENAIEEIGSVSGNNFIHGGSRPLEEITLEGFWPSITSTTIAGQSSYNIPSYVPVDSLKHGLVGAAALKNLFSAAMKAAQPVNFTISRPQDLDKDTAKLYGATMIIKSLEFEYRAGSGLDIYYTMSLKRWFRQSFRVPRPVSTGPTGATGATGATGTTRPPAGQGGNRTPSPTRPSNQGLKKYKIKSGDTLWGIADKFLGDGRKWKKVFNLNKDILNKALKDRGKRYPNPDLIYPGTIIRIPKRG